jgi:hypothetical protein
LICFAFCNSAQGVQLVQLFELLQPLELVFSILCPKSRQKQKEGSTSHNNTTFTQKMNHSAPPNIHYHRDTERALEGTSFFWFSVGLSFFFFFFLIIFDQGDFSLLFFGFSCP